MNNKWFERSVWLKCSRNTLSTRISNLVICCVWKRLEQNNTLEISSDLSEVLDWSALEMLSASASPIWLPVTSKCCTKKFFFENEQSIFWNLSGCLWIQTNLFSHTTDSCWVMNNHLLQTIFEKWEEEVDHENKLGPWHSTSLMLSTYT